MCKTYMDFSDFYNHPFIQSISGRERWTVSDNTKRPIDMFVFIHQFGRVTGAAFTDENSLVDLPTLCKHIPNAANNAYYMDVLVDDFVVLDIEKTCPDDIKAELLKLPYIYGETSLSGKGYHLVFPAPACLQDYPVAMKKTAMKDPKGHYEILLNHYVTFTRNMIPPADENNTGDFEALFRKMAIDQKDVNRTDVDIKSIEPEHGPDYDKIVGLLRRQEYKKSLSDFYDDFSKFEYGCMGFFHFKLKQILKVNTIAPGYAYSDNEKAWIIYEICKDKIPYRAKHDEMRDGLPWLLYLAREVIAKDDLDNKKKKSGKKT